MRYDTQARFTDAGSGFAQYLFRPALGYESQGGTRYWLGYGRFETEAASGARFHENRYWQQADLVPWRMGAGTLALRARLEQRLLSESSDTRITLRFRLRYERPLADNDRRWFVALEPFIEVNETDWGGPAGLSQHRVAAGMSWPLAAGWRFEAGYLNQYLHRRGRRDTSNHLLALHFKHAF